MMDTQLAQNQENEATTEQKLLKELVKLQRQTNKDLAEFKKLIGWLYIFLIIAIILGIYLVFYIISGGRL
jgi:hypothetical protein